MTDAKPFEDTAIFQGWVEFKDDTGQEWRYERSDGKIFKYYEDSRAFIYQGVIKSGLRQPVAIYRNIINSDILL